MRTRGAALLFVPGLAAALFGCGEGGESDTPPASPCAPPTRLVGERCIEPGVQDDGCPAGTLGLGDGTCQPAGIPPGGCAEGFVHDGDVGCEPILPADPCPLGLMAVPGDTACRPVMACGQGNWGDIPVEGGTVYVDQSFTGVSDGSSAAPYKTIGEAVTASALGALVAVAAGSYLEDVRVVSKPVRLWGVCPERVELVGTGVELDVLYIGGASDTEVHGLAIRGAALGLLLAASEDVVFDRVWVHDTADRGIEALGSAGATSLHVTGSLIEHSHDVGLVVGGSDVTLERSVVRGTLPQAADQLSGRGVSVQLSCSGGVCDPTARSTATVRGSLIEQNHDIGLFVRGSDATVEGSVVRGTLPRASDQLFGRGVSVQLSCMGGVCDPSTRSTATVRGSLIEQNHELGLFVVGSDATVEGTIVRTNLPRASDQLFGRGVVVQLSCIGGVCDPSTRSSASVRCSLIEQNHDLGLLVMGSDATVESTIVRGTLPRASDQHRGRGVHIELSCSQPDACDPSTRSTANVRGSLIEQNHDVGLVVSGSDASVEGTIVSATLPAASDQLFGDGITLFHYWAPASATITASLIADSARAGLSSFGAFASLGATSVECAAFEIEGEPYEGHAFSFEDRGGNACGCPLANAACVAVSTGIAPPEPIELGE